MPLKDIKAIMKAPEFDKNELLKSQQKILVLKKERLERIIRSIDSILKGDNRMDFVAKQLFQMKDMTDGYLHDQDMKEKIDRVYGDGYTEYIRLALEAFYKR